MPVIFVPLIIARLRSLGTLTRSKYLGQISIGGVSINVSLSWNAPRSSWYFKRITGLLDSPVGAMKVHFAFPGMNVLMFEGDSKRARGLIPENTPKDTYVKAGEIGITNMSRKHIGMVGVRFEDGAGDGG